MVEKWSIKDFDYLRQWANDYQNGKFGFGEASKKYYRLPQIPKQLKINKNSSSVNYSVPITFFIKLAKAVKIS